MESREYMEFMGALTSIALPVSLGLLLAYFIRKLPEWFK